MNPGRTKILDSWAMLAWLQNEPAAVAVDALLRKADTGSLALHMSWYNVAETFYILAKRKGVAIAEIFLERVPSLPLRVVLPDEQAIMAAARIKAAHLVAFGDAFAIALARAEKASVVTGDPEIRKCRAVSVDWLGS